MIPRVSCSPQLGAHGECTAAHTRISPGSPLVVLCRAPAAPCHPARPCRDSSRLAAHVRRLHPFSSMRAAMDPRGRQCRPGRFHILLLLRPAPKAHTQSGAAGRFFRRARPHRGPGPERAAQKSERTRPVEATANLFQDRPFEDHVDHCIWDCLWDCKRLAKLLGGFGNLETRRGRRCIAKHRARNSASHTGVRGLAARVIRAAGAEEERGAFASAWPARWRAHPKSYERAPVPASTYSCVCEELRRARPPLGTC